MPFEDVRWQICNINISKGWQDLEEHHFDLVCYNIGDFQFLVTLTSTSVCAWLMWVLVPNDVIPNGTAANVGVYVCISFVQCEGLIAQWIYMHTVCSV